MRFISLSLKNTDIKYAIFKYLKYTWILFTVRLF